jgi:predicted RNA-binding protein
MPIPPHSQIGGEIIEYLKQVGGQARTAEIHDYLANKWQLTREEMSQKDSAGGIRWKKRIDQPIEELVKKRQIIHPQRGVCQIGIKPVPPIVSPPTVLKKGAGEQSYHDKIRDMLYEIGEIEKMVSEKEYRINGERIDVAWKRIAAGMPSSVFEVQVGGNFYEALAKLKHAWDKWSSRPFLVTTAEQKQKASEWLSGSFHEIQQEINIVDCKKVEELYQAVKKASDIKTELGIIK